MDNWIELLKKNDYIGIKKYIKTGGDISAENETGESVLACAIKFHCDDDILMLLIESGADIFEFDNEGVSIFDMAIANNKKEIVKYIIDAGIDVNSTNRRSGFTPLMAAVCYGRVEIIKILLKQGANIYAIDSKGLNAIDFAKKLHKKNVLKLLE